MTPVNCLRNKIIEIDSEIVRVYEVASGSESSIVRTKFDNDKKENIRLLHELKLSYEMAVKNLIES